MHDSPHTCFTSDGTVTGQDLVAACRRAALDVKRRIEQSEPIAVYQPAEIDIVTYFDQQLEQVIFGFRG
ncbi:hypothetical protein Lesp02_14620 [Lentzea sp. NBRC 105346]|nr:hypothetical protein Lesp02_14620 [Lentzea sp. NBRC 105346]